MPLYTVPISRGVATLGRWGSLVLTGAASGVLQLTLSEDVELSEAIAANITTPNVRLLNDELGRLLFLPYEGDAVAAYDLSAGDMIYPPILLSRNRDDDMRMADVRLLMGAGVVYLTESALALFREDCTLAWLVEDDFVGWDFEAITPEKIHLLFVEWSGRELRQTISLADGRQLHSDARP